jgi:dUTP pyrophosphatase|tara:strand:+ start:526 stop:1035 length:510 start_codon:yes stop_codon:yes gene_type:complete
MNTLRIKVLDESLESLYKKRVNVEGDAGVDLYFPDEVTIPSKALGLKVDLKIQAEMVQEVNSQLMTNIPKEMLKGMNIEERSLSYMVLPRSSIIKTPLRMSNSIGIMDAGYRGNFMVPIDNLSDEDFIIEKHTRLFQVVSSNLNNIDVKIVNKLSTSKRGTGGFGSTGN